MHVLPEVQGPSTRDARPLPDAPHSSPCLAATNDDDNSIVIRRPGRHERLYGMEARVDDTQADKLGRGSRCVRCVEAVSSWLARTFFDCRGGCTLEFRGLASSGLLALGVNRQVRYFVVLPKSESITHYPFVRLAF